MTIDISDLKNRFKNGENIITHLKVSNDGTLSSNDAIMISYDLQSGTYIRNVKKEPEFNSKYTSEIARYINKTGIEHAESILEVGVGEATTLVNLVRKLTHLPKTIFGFDLSWSRIKYAQQYIKEKNVDNITVFQGDLFDIPLPNNSIDLVYTSHSLESNGGRETEALQELFRVAKKYVLMVEPSYKFANWSARKRMRAFNYVKNLDKVAKRLGYKIITNEAFPISANTNNPSGIIIIEKETMSDQYQNPDLVCPITRHKLEVLKNFYYSENGGYAYPILDGIPCIRKEYGILATHLNKKDFRIET